MTLLIFPLKGNLVMTLLISQLRGNLARILHTFHLPDTEPMPNPDGRTPHHLLLHEKHKNAIIKILLREQSQNHLQVVVSQTQTFPQHEEALTPDETLTLICLPQGKGHREAGGQILTSLLPGRGHRISVDQTQISLLLVALAFLPHRQ